MLFCQASNLRSLLLSKHHVLQFGIQYTSTRWVNFRTSFPIDQCIKGTTDPGSLQLGIGLLQGTHDHDGSWLSPEPGRDSAYPAASYQTSGILIFTNTAK